MLRARLGLFILALAACGDDPPAAYDTYQACFDDVIEPDPTAIVPSIVQCCLKHPIEGVVPACKDTVPDCINYLTANLKQTDASPPQVQQACMDYITQRGL